MVRWASLPMYPWPAQLSQQYWDFLCQGLSELGEEGLPRHLMQPLDYLAHWRQHGLLLSQSCGYPVSTLLQGQVQVVGAFHYQLPGCEDWRYSSALMVRKADAAAGLADFRGRRVVCNDRHSQSGYHALRSELARQVGTQPFFGRVLFSGSHRMSLSMLAEGQADIAAIDCVTAHLLAQQQPQLLDQLACIGHTARQPGLPLITAGDTTQVTLERLRVVIAQSLQEASLQPFFQAAAISGFSVLGAEDYTVLARQAQALRLQGMSVW